MRHIAILISLSFFIYQDLSAQIDPSSITIVRDSFGVPHIYAPTDAAAAYGLAWAYCEDDFESMHQPLLGARQRFAEVKGKKGALLDAISFLVDANKVVEEQYEKELSPKFRTIVEGYAAGVNAYATQHPEEVQRPGLFPISGKDIIKGYVVSMTFISNVHYDLVRIFQDQIQAQEEDMFTRGSNGFAVSPNRTADGQTYFISNSHQPLEGPLAWYECQVNSDEGWHFHGATFAGGVTPFVGTNPNLGWTHCINFDDFDDVYKLTMHPQKKLHYKFDGEWIPLEKRVLKLKVKVGPVRIPAKRTFYRSKYGPTIERKGSFYSMRFPSNMTVKAAEQWYHMNKASNFEEWRSALDIQGLSNTAMVYADREGNIFFLGNGLHPYRDPAFNWAGVVPGDTSATLWPAKFHPVSTLPQVLNPKSGYVFNANNTALDCTAPDDNPKAEDYPAAFGLQPKNTARAFRIHTLIDPLEKISFDDLKRIKYDDKLPLPIYTRSIENLDMIRQFDAKDYPFIADAIDVLNRWDGGTSIDNRQAAVASLAILYYTKYIRDEGLFDYNNVYPEDVLVEGLVFAKEHLNKYFGKLEIPLGDLQKHVRGDVELPIWGIPEVIAQMRTVPHRKGMIKSELGESFILLARFDKNQPYPSIETICPYGTSNRPESPHYTDQMQLFVDKQTKPASLDKADVMRRAERVYHPGEH